MSTHEQQESIPIQLLKEGATETKGKDAACMILRIDNIISAAAPKSDGPPPYGGMPEY